MVEGRSRRRAGRSGLRRRFARARFRRWFGIHFALAVALFGLAGVAGYLAADLVSIGGLSELREASQLPAEPLLPSRITVGTILLNNLVAMAVTALGIVTLGLVAALSVAVNGFFLGLVFGLAAPVLSPATALALVLPHGVIELTAFFLVAAISFRVTHRLARYLAGYDERILTRQELFEIAVLLVAAAGLIAVAAVIEVHVTPAVGDLVA